MSTKEQSYQSRINAINEELELIRKIAKGREREKEAKDKTIAAQRATIAKLRKKLAEEADASVTFEDMAEQYRAEAETWRSAHQQLANAIGRR